MYLQKARPMALQSPVPRPDPHASGVDCAAFLKVLADQTRLAVVKLLIGQALTVGELNESLGVEQTLLSHHLRVLRDAAIVQCQREGRSMRYSLSAQVRSARRGSAIELGCCKIVFE